MCQAYLQINKRKTINKKISKIHEETIPKEDTGRADKIGKWLNPANKQGK